MKKLLFAAILFVSTPAMAIDPATPVTPATPTATSPDQGNFYRLGDSDRPEINFEESKARMLKNMDNRIADMQKRQTCIKAAENPEVMRTCFSNAERPRARMEKRNERSERGDRNERAERRERNERGERGDMPRRNK
ncbi:MAG: hypothetical protein KAS59_05770 [Alphaproteobacteria bacterium]|nr:hypothetical protein [Alphaproteobacteria bacterium]